MVIENAPDSVPIDRDPNIVQGIPDPGISPGLILSGHLNGQIGNPVSHPWPPGSSFGRSIVFSGYKCPEPT